jgi:hypothetical protein
MDAQEAYDERLIAALYALTPEDWRAVIAELQAGLTPEDWARAFVERLIGPAEGPENRHIGLAAYAVRRAQVMLADGLLDGY